MYTRKVSSSRPLVASIITVMMAALLLMTCSKTEPQKALPDETQNISQIFGVNPAFATMTPGQATSIADVAERTVASVVNISTTRSARIGQTQPFGPLDNDPTFRRFFGPHGQMPQEFQQNALGSGVIVSKDGVILTNHHVVAEADEIRVTLADGREIGATVAGTDEKSDLAVLRLDRKVDDLSPLPIGDSSKLRLGDVVLAIGNPFGVGQTVTMGIVSAKGRTRVGIVDYEEFIQTDAAINPGNSGGALVDMHGQLVGINTAILSRTGGSQGIGFAIPVDMARPIAESLLENGKVERGWLGVGIQDLNQGLAKGLGLAIENGVLVSSVSAGSPADKAGLERGDVIVELDGAAMDSSSQLRNLIAAAGPDKRVALTVVRNGERKSFAVTLGTLADASPPANQPVETREGVLGGVRVSGLSPVVRQRYELPESLSGVMVTALAPGSAAARAGLRPGDVILEIDKRAIDGPAAFRERARAADDKPAVLLVWRDGNTVYLLVRD